MTAPPLQTRRRDKPIIFSAAMVRALLDGRKTQTRRLIRDVVPNAPAFDNVVHKPRHPVPYLDAYCGERKTAENPRGMGPNWCWWTRDDRCGQQFRVGYMPGDRLWVRETWQAAMSDNGPCILYRASHDRWYPAWTCPDEGMGSSFDYDRYPADYSAWASDVEGSGPWSSPIHMPHWASRLTLTVTGLRVQRLQEISEEDAIAEGVTSEILHFSNNRIWGVPGAMVHGFIDARSAYACLWNSLHGPDAWSANPWVVALTFTVDHANIDALREAA